MNLSDDPRTSAFLTNVGLITSRGSFGDNIMACEWTHMISHDPGLIALAIRSHKATYLNIVETKVFGVSMVAFDQNVVTSVAGKGSGRELNKIEILKELGFEFYPAEEIGVLMVKGAAMNAECRLVQQVEIGDHPLLIGEIVSIRAEEKEPLAYHKGKYWKLGEQILKPGEDVLGRIEKVREKWRKGTA